MLKIQLNNYRTVFIVAGLIGVLLFASPTIALMIKPPAGQEFSEIYLLGPNHTLENLPFNIVAGTKYLVYLGVGNQMGRSSYYTCIVKMGNQTASLPNATIATPSTLPALCEYNLFIGDGATWEAPLIFQVDKLSIADGASQLSSVNINGIDFPVNETSVWSPDKAGYYYDLIVELWLFNGTQGISQYNNRFVSLVLSMT